MYLPIYNPGPVPVRSGSFGIGLGPAYLTGIHCYGNEKSLTECIGASFSHQSCPQTKDVGVVCAGTYVCNIRTVSNSNDILTSLLV